MCTNDLHQAHAFMQRKKTFSANIAHQPIPANIFSRVWIVVTGSLELGGTMYMSGRVQIKGSFSESSSSVLSMDLSGPTPTILNVQGNCSLSGKVSTSMPPPHTKRYQILSYTPSSAVATALTGRWTFNQPHFSLEYTSDGVYLVPTHVSRPPWMWVAVSALSALIVAGIIIITVIVLKRRQRRITGYRPIAMDEKSVAAVFSQ